MLAFSDSVEAAQNRVTDAIDAIALWVDGAEVMKDFYNAIAFAINNIGTLTVVVGGLIAILNKDKILSSVSNGLGRVGSGTIRAGDSLSKMFGFKEKEGTEKGFFENAWDIMKTGFQQGAQEDYLAALQKNIKTLDEEDKARAASIATLLMNSSELDRNNYYAAMANELIPEQIAVEESKIVDGKAYSLQLKRQTAQGYETLTEEETLSLCKKLLAQETDEQRQKVLQAITSTNNLTLTQNEYSAVLESLTNAQKNSYNSQVRAAQQGYSATIGEGTKGGLGKATAKGLSLGIGSILSDLVGGYAGSQIGSAFGDTGTIIGTVLGGGILQGVTSVLTSTSFTSMIASKFATIGPIAATALGSAFAPIAIPLIIGVGTALFSWWQGEAKRAAEKAAEVFSEESEKYTSYVNTLNDVGTFDKYIKGVDSLGRNVSLTEEEYQKWLDASNALAEVFPELTMYTDDQGNKIVGLNGKVTELTDTINEYIDAQQRAADQALLDPDLLNASYKEAKEQWDDAENSIKMYERALKAFSEYKPYTSDTGSGSVRIDAGNAWKSKEMAEVYRDAGYSATEYGGQVTVHIDEDNYQEELKKLEQITEDTIRNLEGDMDSAVDSMSDEIEGIFREMNDNSQYTDLFANLDDGALTKIKAVVADSITLDASDGEAFRQEVENLFSSIAQDVQDNPAILDLYIEANEADTGADYRALRDQLKNTIISAWGDDFATWSEERKAFVVELGFEITENGLVDSTDTLQKIKDLVGGDVSFNTGWFDSLGLEDQNKVFEMFRNNVVDATTETQTLANLLYSDRETSGLDETMTKLNEQLDIFTELGPRIQEFYENYSGNSEDLAKAVAESFSDVPEEIRTKIEDGYDEFQEAGEGAGTEFVAGMMEEIYDSNLTNQYEAYLGELAQTAFPDLEFDGYIDTFEELGSAMESLVGQFDKLKAAQAEQAATGKLSWQTIFDLVGANMEYIKALDTSTGSIKLKSNAEQIMLGIQKSAIKANIEAAISEIENRNEILNTAIQKLKQGQDVSTVANTVADSANVEIAAIDKTTNAWIKAGKAASAYNSAAAGEMDWETYNSIIGDIGQSNVSSSRASRGSGFSGTGASTGSSGGSFSSGARGGGFSSLKQQNTLAWAETLGVDDIVSISADDFLTYGYAAGNQEAMGLIDNYTEQINDNMTTIEAYRNFLNNLETNANLDTWYTTPDYDSGSSSGSGGGDDEIESAKKYLETLQQLQSLINKEWEDMVAFANNTDSAYYGKMRENLTAQLNEVNRLLENYDEYLAAGMLEESDYNDLMQQRIDLQVELNNLDDEQVQEAIDLLETQDASINSLIEAQKQLIETSDTYEELIERQQELNELIEEQKELQRDVYEFERTMAEMASEYVSGTAFTNAKIYDAFMSLQKQSIEEQMESLLDSYNTVVTQKMQQYSAEGMSPGEAYNMAYDSEEARELIQEYWELFQEYGDLVYQEFEDKVNELDQMIEDIEYTKPDEWGNINDIAPYYETLIGYVEQKVKQIEEALSDTSMMTDEQIQDWVDQYNDAIQELRDLQQQQLEDTIQYQEDTFSALTSWVQEQIDALQDLQDTIDDEYQPLIDDINDYNDAVDRTNELLKLQKNLKDSLSSKERVYREGMKMPSIKAR